MKRPYWINDLTVEHNPDNFHWEIWDRQRADIVATFNDDYFSKETVWKILEAASKKINKRCPTAPAVPNETE